jgi:hypothetical protein
LKASGRISEDIDLEPEDCKPSCDLTAAEDLALCLSRKKGLKKTSLSDQLQAYVKHIEGYQYRIKIGSGNKLQALVFQTSRQRYRLMKFGDMLWFDGTHVPNEAQFKMFFPTIRDEWGRIQRVGCVIAEGETHEMCGWSLQQLQHMCPEVSNFGSYNAILLT